MIHKRLFDCELRYYFLLFFKKKDFFFVTSVFTLSHFHDISSLYANRFVFIQSEIVPGGCIPACYPTCDEGKEKKKKKKQQTGKKKMRSNVNANTKKKKKKKAKGEFKHHFCNLFLSTLIDTKTMLRIERGSGTILI